MSDDKTIVTLHFNKSDDRESITIPIPESFNFGDLTSGDFDRFLSFFDWSLKDKSIEFDNSISVTRKKSLLILYYLYYEYLILNNCKSFSWYQNELLEWKSIPRKTNAESFEKLFDSKNKLLELIGKNILPIVISNSEDQAKALKFVEKFTGLLDAEYEITIRYIINEILYNTLEHSGHGHDIPSFLQFFWNEESKELSFIVADVGVGIKKHLRQTYMDLETDVEAILLAIKPQISGTFGKSATGYETIDNAGVGLFISSNIVQRLKGDMFIVSGNGFVHISPAGTFSQELKSEWKGTFVYVKMKLGLVKDLNLQKMLSEITKSIPKTDKNKETDNFYINIKNYFGLYAENKDLAKKIRDEKLLPALAENKTLTIDFDEIVSAPHSLLNAMLATPIERLGLKAYKKIKIINAAPEIRETLDFIFDDNTSNA